MLFSSVSRMYRLSVPAVFFAALSCASTVFAAHPLITDDTGTMGTGKAQLELNGEYGHDKEEGITTNTTEGAATLSYGISETVDLVVGLPYHYSREQSEEAIVREHDFADNSLEVK